jgi:hypothetical protein
MRYGDKGRGRNVHLSEAIEDVLIAEVLMAATDARVHHLSLVVSSFTSQ